MANNSLDINEQNLYGWLCSVGYLLPCTEPELQRFEVLHPAEGIKVNEECIDPFAIINGTRKRKPLSFMANQPDESVQYELRMAARKYQNLPQDIIDRIIRNQQSDDHRDGSKNQ